MSICGSGERKRDSDDSILMFKNCLKNILGGGKWEVIFEVCTLKNGLKKPKILINAKRRGRSAPIKVQNNINNVGKQYP